MVNVGELLVNYSHTCLVNVDTMVKEVSGWLMDGKYQYYCLWMVDKG